MRTVGTPKIPTKKVQKRPFWRFLAHTWPRCLFGHFWWREPWENRGGQIENRGDPKAPPSTILEATKKFRKVGFARFASDILGGSRFWCVSFRGVPFGFGGRLDPFEAFCCMGWLEHVRLFSCCARSLCVLCSSATCRSRPAKRSRRAGLSVLCCCLGRILVT